MGGIAAGQPAAEGSRRVRVGPVDVLRGPCGEWLALADRDRDASRPCPATVAMATGSTGIRRWQEQRRVPWKAPLGISPSSVGRLFVGAAYRLGSATRMGASVTYEQSPFRRGGLGAASRAGMEVALGLERGLSRRLAARATVTEHMSALGDRADIGFSVQLRYHP